MASSFIVVRDPGIPAGEVLSAARSTASTHALLIKGQTPVALIDVDVLGEGDPSPVMELIEDAQRLSRASFDAEAEEERPPAPVHFGDQIAVVMRHDQPLVVFPQRRLDSSEDVKELFASAQLYAITADSQLPGRPDPNPDPIVTYICEQGDRVPQPLSCPNTVCPFDGTQLIR